MSTKRLAIVGIIIVLLIAIPLIVYGLKQQELQKYPNFSKIPSIYFSPNSYSATEGNIINLSIMVNSQGRQLSSMRLTINYDPTKLTTISGSFIPIGLSVVQGPVYTKGSIEVTLSNNTNKPLSPAAKIAVISFQTLNLTDINPTSVSIDSSTNAISSSYQEIPMETNSANIDIISSSVLPTTIPNSSESANLLKKTSIIPPVCLDLQLNPSASGSAPYDLTVASLAESSSSSLLKATFNFGDGQTQTIQKFASAGANLQSAATSHTYTTAGIYNISAGFTDINGISSRPSASCLRRVTIN